MNPKDVLEFERQWFRRPGSKEQAIRERFGVSAFTYYARLNEIIDHPACLGIDPQTVNRLRRVRAQRLATPGRRGA